MGRLSKCNRLAKHATATGQQQPGEGGKAIGERVVDEEAIAKGPRVNVDRQCLSLSVPPVDP